MSIPDEREASPMPSWTATARAVLVGAAVVAVLALAIGSGPQEGTLADTPTHGGLPIVSTPAAALSTLEGPLARPLGWWLGLVALSASAVIAGVRIVPARLASPLARTALAVTVLFAMAPARVALEASPETVIATLAVVVWIASVAGGRDRLGGAALGAASVLSFPAWSLLALEALRARTRRLVWAVAVIGTFAALSLLAFGLEPHRGIVSGLAEGRATTVASYDNQSITALVTRLTARGPLDDPTPRPLGPIAAAGAALFTLALAAVALRTLLGSRLGRRAGSRARRPGDPLLEVPAVLPLGLLALPIAREQDLLLLGPALIALGVGLDERGLSRRPGFAVGWIAAVVLLALPVPAAPPPGPPLLAGILVSTRTLAAILTLVVAVAGLQRSADGEDVSREG